MAAYRSKVVKLAQSWVGLSEADGSYKKIIDTYNGYKGKFPRGIKMQYGWSWCACTWSALAIALGYTDVMPIEISCGELINAAKRMGCWVEDDGYVPKPGDAILYDWDDRGSEDCRGWSDHVGVIEKVNKGTGYMVAIEGNYSDSVKRRTVSINGRYIRGFITPKYDEEENASQNKGNYNNVYEIAHAVIAGDFGNGDERKAAVEKLGYNYAQVQNAVNFILNGNICDVNKTEQDQPIRKHVTATCKTKYKNPSLAGTYETTANLYCRNDAGTNKKALCKIPNGTKVKCKKGKYGQDSDNVKWLYINVVLDGVKYTGYSCVKYLKKIG